MVKLWSTTAHSERSFKIQKIVFIGLIQCEIKYRLIKGFLDEAERSRVETASVLSVSFDSVGRLMELIRK